MKKHPVFLRSHLLSSAITAGADQCHRLALFNIHRPRYILASVVSRKSSALATLLEKERTSPVTMKRYLLNSSYSKKN